MPNPMVPQGSLNRLRATITLPGFPELNVTAPFLGPDGVSLGFDGAATQTHGTMTGTVQSPEPYQMATLSINLLRTQNLAQLYEDQRKTDSRIGEITVKTDSTTLGEYELTNCAIQNVRELQFAGKEPGYMVTITGYYQINNSLWDIV